jgi:transposase
LLKNGGNSNRSSTPPSHDIGRSNSKSIREKTGRTNGGQQGHEGTTLRMKKYPDVVIDLIPDYCNNCGAKMDVPYEFVECKQEVELPPIEPQYIEYRSYSKTCKCCGHHTVNRLPERLKAPIQFGPSIKTLVAYLSVVHYLPYQRMTKLFKDAFHLPISEGTIDNILGRMALSGEPIYAAIKEKIYQSKVVGSDETGIHINGKKAWLNAWQTPHLTFIASSLKRNYKTIENLFPDGLTKSVLVSDCWAAQLKTPAATHQLCIVHLLRELNNFIDAFDCQWSVEMKQLFKEALEQKKKMQPVDYLYPNERVKYIENKLDELLKADLTTKHKKLQAFIKRLLKNRSYILNFLYYERVPPDNNTSEQAIRNAKVKMKVSGQFRSPGGAKRFSILRSIIDTANKNSKNIFEILSICAAI